MCASCSELDDFRVFGMKQVNPSYFDSSCNVRQPKVEFEAPTGQHVECLA
jgi:hypothetical protein